MLFLPAPASHHKNHQQVKINSRHVAVKIELAIIFFFKGEDSCVDGGKIEFDDFSFLVIRAEDVCFIKTPVGGANFFSWPLVISLSGYRRGWAPAATTLLGWFT